MKIRFIITLLAVSIIWGCSAPKYTYHFDHYDYNSGRKKAVENPENNDAGSNSVLSVDANSFESGLSEKPVQSSTKAGPVLEKSVVQDKLSSMTTSERSQL